MTSFYDLFPSMLGGQQPVYAPSYADQLMTTAGPTPAYGAPVAPPQGGVPAPNQPSNAGIPWGPIIQGIGGLLTGYGAVSGANAQNAASQATLQAQRERQQQIMSMIAPLMQGGQNPYGGAYLQMLNSLMQFNGQPYQGPQYGAPNRPNDTQPSAPWPPPTLGYPAGGFAPSSAPGGGGFSPPMTAQYSAIPNVPWSQLPPSHQPGGSLPPVPITQQTNPPIPLGPNGLMDPRQSRLQQPFTYTPTASIGLQQFNPGQDGLLQMMRRNIEPTRDSQLDWNLNRQASGMESFNNSDLFKALEPLDQRNIDRQVAQLRAGAGSLGSRFGTAMQQNENTLRTDALANIGVRNANLARDSYESGQGRSMQALGLQLPYQQSREQQLFQNAGVQLNAGQAYGGLFNQFQGLDLNAQQANQEARNRGGEFNANAGMQRATFNTSQDSQANQLMLSLLSAAQGAQNTQLGQNTGLISLLAGLPVPSQSPQANPWGDIGQMAMLLPYLMRG